MSEETDILAKHAERRRAFLAKTAATSPVVGLLLAQSARPARAATYGGGTTMTTSFETTTFTLTMTTSSPTTTFATTTAGTTPFHSTTHVTVTLVPTTTGATTRIATTTAP
jgi:hypothetical protein